MKALLIMISLVLFACEFPRDRGVDKKDASVPSASPSGTIPNKKPVVGDVALARSEADAGKAEAKKEPEYCYDIPDGVGFSEGNPPEALRVDCISRRPIYPRSYKRETAFVLKQRELYDRVDAPDSLQKLQRMLIRQERHAYHHPYPAH